MAFLRYLVKKLNILIILLACLVYFFLFLVKVDVNYGSVAFAIIHAIIITTIIYSVFRLIFPLKNEEKVTKKQSNKKTESVKQLKKQTDTEGVFYKVKQHENYYFKEFDNRYELYKKTPNGMRYVKTDYKKDLNSK